MVKLDNWEKVLQLKDRINVIYHELNKINRFLSNPFENKSLTVDKRKTMWIKATKKKQGLEKELAETKKQLGTIIDQNKKYERGGKQK
jgi:hypothetical protein